MMSWVAVLLRLPADVTRTPATSSSAAMISFFFQAEDGIRDGHVTGVQTCALPLPDSFYDDPEAFGKEPVGNGPYEFASWTNNEEITVDKWEDFPGEEPGQVDSIQWRMYDDQDTAYQDLISGNLDIMAPLRSAE